MNISQPRTSEIHIAARPSAQAGIAIGPILFVLALLGIIAVFMSSSTSSVGNMGAEDSITANVVNQANLIRNKIVQCNMYGEYGTTWPTDGSGGTGTGLAVSSLDCQDFPSGQQNLWTGLYPVQLPPPPNGFGVWTYYDYGATGGRCIGITPTSVNATITNALTRAFTKFTTAEADYNSGGGTQNFVVWIKHGSGAAGANCTAN